jgi:co-chaperonin GroES (HSP10)
MINESGWIASDDNCLLRPKKVEEKTKGGILLPGAVIEEQEWTQVVCELVSYGPRAFDDFNGEHPQVGDFVLINRYVGQELPAKLTNDGSAYRYVKDRDIITYRKDKPND